jgi:F-type H+-transporting ATPase subunit b
MHHEVNTFWMIVNVLIQIINIVLFFVLFRFFLAQPIVEAIEKRKKLLDKIKNAEQEYQRLIEEAQQEKRKILEEAEKHKLQIIEEAKATALKEKEKIISDAKRKADDIIESAKAEAEKLKKMLEENWLSSVKYTTKLVINKLFNENKQLSDQYLETLIKEFEK